MSIMRIVVAVALYVIAIGLIIVIKPAMMFSPDNKIKVWGTSDEESIFSPMVVFPVISIVCYYISAWIDIMA